MCRSFLNVRGTVLSLTSALMTGSSILARLAPIILTKVSSCHLAVGLRGHGVNAGTPLPTTWEGSWHSMSNAHKLIHPGDGPSGLRPGCRQVV